MEQARQAGDPARLLVAPLLDRSEPAVVEELMLHPLVVGRPALPARASQDQMRQVLSLGVANPRLREPLDERGIGAPDRRSRWPGAHRAEANGRRREAEEEPRQEAAIMEL